MAISADVAVAVVRRREEAALASLGQATGDATLCSIARSGGSHPAGKYHEGQARAMADVRRAVRTAQRRGDAGDVLASCRVVEASWRAQADARAGRGPDWAAYYAGGLDALAELAEELSAPVRGDER